MSQINAYLNFNGNCREAMRFYKECLGGDLSLQTVGESPMAQNMPAIMKDAILHSSLENGVLMIMGSDMCREKLVDGNSVHLCINCNSEEEIRTLFAKLSEGGMVTEPLTEMFWGATFGTLTDRFGKQWMFNYTKYPQQ